MPTISAKVPPAELAHMLIELSIPPHRFGFPQLCMIIPLYKQDRQQSMAGELYPAVAKALGYPDWRAVEHTIRSAIVTAWNHRNPDVWARYFPDLTEPPSNKRFIATLAEYI